MCISRKTKRSVGLRAKRSRAGFSFLEIMIVVVIIGILSGIIGTRVIGGAEKAKIKATRAQIQSIKTALGTYDMNVGELPSTEQGLLALVECPDGVDEEDWAQVMEDVPLDGWKKEFIYRSPSEESGRDYDLISKGKDGVADNEDDITNRRRERNS